MKHYVGLVFVRHWLGIANLLLATAAFSQEIAIGTWRTHFSYTDAQIVETSDTKAFCATTFGFFSRDLVTGETRKLSKLDGLSDVGITAMAYAPEPNVLVLGYETGIIDLVFEDRIVGLTDIATSSLDRDKRINAISTGGGRAYVASDFGVVVVDFDQAEITENFLQIGSDGVDVIADEVLVRNDSLFVVTGEGIQTGALADNLLDFNNWTRYPATVGYSDLSSSAQGLFAIEGSNLIRFTEGLWLDSGIDLPAGTRGLKVLGGALYAFDNATVYVLDAGAFVEVLTSAVTQLNDIGMDQRGDFLLADTCAGLLDASGNSLSPDGPLEDTFWRVRVLEQDVYALHAPDPSSYDGTQQVPNYSLFTDGRWTAEAIEGFTNVSDVGSFNGVRYFSSIGDGLYISGSGVLEDIPGSGSASDTLLTGIYGGETLYLTAYGEDPLHQLDPSGNWESYAGSLLFGAAFDEVAVAQLGALWLLNANQSLTLFSPVDGRVAVINTADGIPSSVSDFALSVADNVWIATPRGPAFFPDASFAFDGAQAVLPTFENRVLFEDEVINTVATDGGNRVWFGTNRGLWVFNENTSEQEAFFDVSNSPLPANEVINLAHQPRTGEVYVVTTKGMVSYRSASSVAASIHTDVSVFPNPVRPEYEGQVGISGLAANAHVKITDVNGNLVREVSANGGTAAWDLRTLDGDRVVTGIYYFFSATSDGEETFVGKLAVVR